MKHTKRKQKKNLEPNYKIFVVVIMTLYLVLLPLLTYLKIWKVSDALSSVFPVTQGYTLDYFLYYKEVLTIGMAMFLLAFFLGEHIFPDRILWDTPVMKRENRIILVCAAVYILMIVLATICSKYRGDLLMGSPSDGEGCFALVSYIILMLAGMNYFIGERRQRILLRGILILVCVLVLLTCIELSYKPILEIPLLQRLIAAPQYADLAASLKSAYSNDMIALTLYNAGYLGGLCILLFPHVMMQIFTQDSTWKAVLYMMLTALFMITLFCTKSSGASYLFIGEIVVVLIWIFRRKPWKNGLKRLLMCLGIIIVVFYGMNLLSGGKVWSAGKADLVNPSYQQDEQTFILKNIHMSGNRLELMGEEQTIVIELKENPSGNWLEFSDGKGTPLIADGEDKIEFEGAEYLGCSIQLSGNKLIVDLGYPDTLEFYVAGDGFHGIGQGGQAIDTVSRDNYYFEKWYGFATGRGYTWIQSLPLLKETILLGKGPASFAMYFMQNDYVGLINTHGSAKYVIDKPHNMYLQTAIQTGGLSLIAILVLFASLIFRMGKWGMQMWKNKKSCKTVPLEGIGIGLIAFMILGMVNDSIITVNPIFWLLLGVGLQLYSMDEQNQLK